MTEFDRLHCIRCISELPTRLRSVVRRIERARAGRRGSTVTDAGAGADGAWSVVELLHHAADRHLHDYMAMKRMLTADRPRLAAWNWRALAALPDAREAPADASLALLQGLHLRWTMMLASLDEEGWRREGLHDTLGEVTVERLAAECARECDELVARLEGIAAASEPAVARPGAPADAYPARRRTGDPLGLRLVSAFGLVAEARLG